MVGKVKHDERAKTRVPDFDMGLLDDLASKVISAHTAAVKLGQAISEIRAADPQYARTIIRALLIRALFIQGNIMHFIDYYLPDQRSNSATKRAPEKRK
jgi:hypothetical protein